MNASDLKRVSIQELPLDLWHRSRLWFEELLREFQVIASEVDNSVPRDLLTFVETTTERFGRFSKGAETLLEQAHLSGQPAIDLELDLPPAVSVASAEMKSLISRAAAFAREGSLLTMAPNPEILDFIDWYLDEVTAQLAGADPVPWLDRSHET